MVDKVLFELDSIMHNHGCEVTNELNTTTGKITKAYKTNNDVVWKALPGKNTLTISLYMPKESSPREERDIVIKDKMTMKAVASVLNEMRQMAEDVATQR